MVLLPLQSYINEVIVMRFGDIVKELLEENDISQKKMAQDLNIGITTLGNYIRGVREPDFHMLKAIAEYFSVSTDYLLDNHSALSADHDEDQLLHIYRSLPDNLRPLLIEHGKVLSRFSLKNNR